MVNPGPETNHMKMMGILPQLGMNFRPEDPFPEALLEANTQVYLHQELRNIVAGEVSSTWSRFPMAVHGTAVDRALSIVKDGAVSSFERLLSQGSPVVRNNAEVLTDVLDIELGLHRYVFFNLGRVHPVDVHPVYFLFPNNILLGEGVAVALREIVHFGAFVSREAVKAQKQQDPNFSDEKARVRNVEAAQRFLANVFSGKGFRDEIFPRFLEKHDPEQNGLYFTSLEYPGTTVDIQRRGNEYVIANAWEGPQVMVPTHVRLRDFNPAILITDTARDRAISRQLSAAGFPEDRVFKMSEVVSTYKNKYPGIGDYRAQLNRSLYVNLALRDLALLASNNETGTDFPDSMCGFKHRIRNG
jgi:hypothetical protein